MPKRDREDADASTAPAKKSRKGFSVGPENLPEGQHKRKAQQIKRNLIEKAKLKKEYAKVKAAHEAETTADPETTAVSEPHPDRQILIEQGPRDEDEERQQGTFERRQRKPKVAPFAREQRRADQAKAEAEARRKAIEEANQQRQQKLEEREKFRRAMAKAKTPGRDGKRKLGRESTVLLEKVRKMVGGT